MKEFEKMFKELKKDLEEINKEEETETTTLTGDYMICATNEGIQMSGNSAQLCTLLVKIIETLHEEAEIDKELLQKAFDFAFMDMKDIKKETLNMIKSILELDDDDE